jgi:hypothetical protein
MIITKKKYYYIVYTQEVRILEDKYIFTPLLHKIYSPILLMRLLDMRRTFCKYKIIGVKIIQAKPSFMASFPSMVDYNMGV